MSIVITKKCDICGNVETSSSYCWKSGSSSYVSAYIFIFSEVPVECEYFGLNEFKNIKREICPECFEKVLVPFIDSIK